MAGMETKDALTCKGLANWKTKHLRTQDSGLKAFTVIIYCFIRVTCGVQDTLTTLVSSPMCNSVIRGKLDLT